MCGTLTLGHSAEVPSALMNGSSPCRSILQSLTASVGSVGDFVSEHNGHWDDDQRKNAKILEQQSGFLHSK